MPATIEKEPDQKRLVALLAAECHVPIGEMATLYAHERARLALGAHVTQLMSTLCLLHARWAVNARRRSLIEASSPEPRRTISGTSWLSSGVEVSMLSRYHAPS